MRVCSILFTVFFFSPLHLTTPSEPECVGELSGGHESHKRVDRY